MATLTLQQRLDEAEDALHALQIGKQVAEVHDANGESIRYAQGSITRLVGYIADLKRQLGLGTDGPMFLVTG